MVRYAIEPLRMVVLLRRLRAPRTGRKLAQRVRALRLGPFGNLFKKAGSDPAPARMVRLVSLSGLRRAQPDDAREMISCSSASVSAIGLAFMLLERPALAARAA